MADTIVLNEKQQYAHDAMLKYIRGEDPVNKALVLIGYAGTGKTFTLTRTIKHLNAGGDVFDRFSVAMSAPTHKAVRVMRRFSKDLKGVAFATIHSLLGLKEEIDNNGKTKFVQSKDPGELRIEQFDVLFIDESSMLPDEIFKLLMAYQQRSKLKIIFVGDSVQIPPVNHANSKPFVEAEREKYHIGVLELDTIVRQSMDNPILAFATRIRKAYQSDISFTVGTKRGETDPSIGIVAVQADDQEMTNAIIEEYFNCDEFQSNPDHMKIIAWRNATVNTYNNMVRKRIYKSAGPVLPFIMVGEKLIVDKPVILSNNRILLSTNEEIEVERYEEGVTQAKYLIAQQVDREWVGTEENIDLKFYNTWVRYFDEEGTQQVCNIRILHESDAAKLQGAVNKIKTAASTVPYTSPLRNKLWREYFALQRLFAQVKYNYAITAHKS